VKSVSEEANYIITLMMKLFFEIVCEQTHFGQCFKELLFPIHDNLTLCQKSNTILPQCQ